FDLSGVSARGTKILAHVDPSKPCPFTHFDMRTSQNEPFLSIELSANEPTPASVWRFPTAESFNQKLPVVKFSDWWKGPATDTRPLVSILFRAALNDPAIQQKWDGKYGNVDWRQAKQEDAEPS